MSLRSDFWTRSLKESDQNLEKFEMQKKLFMALVAILVIGATTVVFAQQVTIEGDAFPVRINLSKNDTKQTLYASGATSLSGKVTVEVAASPTNGYYVVYKIRLNNGVYSDQQVGTYEVELKTTDTLHVKQIGIVPPSNAALVPFKGGSVLVSLMYPPAVANPDDFNGTEEFRSSALFVAKYGSKAVATKLAKDAKAAGPEAWNHRNNQQISVVRESSGGKVIKAQLEATEDELADAIQLGLIQLQLRGWHAEVTKAKEILRKK